MEEEKNNNNLTKDKLIKAKKQRKWFVLIFLVIVIIVSYVNCRGNYLETLELGEQYLSIFWQNLTSTIIAFIINFLILYILIYITNKRIKKGLIPFFEEEKKQMPKMLNKSIAFIFATIISFFITNTMLEKFMLCINATSFELTDAILGYDIGYFIFVQPFVQYILRYILTVVVGITIYATLYYVIAFNIYFDGINRETLKKSCLIKQLCTNIMVIAILLGGIVFTETLNVGLQRFISLQGETINDAYSLWGAGISEVTIKLWGYRILSVIIIVTVAIAIYYFKNGITKKTLISLLVVPSYLILMTIVLICFEMFFVSPNELDKQQSYIRANINATKQAYGINIEEINLGENETITTKDLTENKTVVNNIVLANKDIVLKNLNTLQTNKGYYTYRTTQIANYKIKRRVKLNIYFSKRNYKFSRNI